MISFHSKLLASDGADYDYFGNSVAVSGDCVVVGAWGNDDNDSDSGSAYVFDIMICPGDFDGNCEVDFLDYAIFVLAWLTGEADPEYNPVCDISKPKDNIIDMLDLAVLVDNWLVGK